MIDSTLSCVCSWSVIDHRWHIMWWKQRSGGQAAGKCVTDVFTTFFTSSVIYYWRDPRQHGIY